MLSTIWSSLSDREGAVGCTIGPILVRRARSMRPICKAHVSRNRVIVMGASSLNVRRSVLEDNVLTRPSISRFLICCRLRRLRIYPEMTKKICTPAGPFMKNLMTGKFQKCIEFGSPGTKP